jgi:hypothetical protein
LGLIRIDRSDFGEARTAPWPLLKATLAVREPTPDPRRLGFLIASFEVPSMFTLVLRRPLLVMLLLVPSHAWANPVESSGTCEIVPKFQANFEPELEWQWSASAVMPTHVQVMMTPVVIELNGDGVPGVVFNTFAGSNYNTNGVIRAISGVDGSEIWTVTDPTKRVRGAASIAAADIDHDGLAEICTVGETGAVIHCFENDGTSKFSFAATNSWGGVSFADLDGDGEVEIFNGNAAYDANGTLLWTGVDRLGGPTGTGPISFAADIDADGIQEVVNDRAIYNADGSLRCRNTTIAHGLAGVGNFDDDDNGEVVVVGSGQVTLMDENCATVWTSLIPGGGFGGHQILPILITMANLRSASQARAFTPCSRPMDL